MPTKREQELEKCLRKTLEELESYVLYKIDITKKDPFSGRKDPKINLQIPSITTKRIYNRIKCVLKEGK